MITRIAITISNGTLPRHKVICASIHHSFDCYAHIRTKLNMMVIFPKIEKFRYMLSGPIIPYHVSIEEYSTPSETTRTRFSKVIIWQIPLYYGIDLTIPNKVVERSNIFL